MRTTTSFAALAAVVSLGLVACGGGADDEALPASSSTALAASAGVTCDNLADSPLAEAARQEGKVVTKAPSTPQVEEQVFPAFEDEMGIDVEVVAGRSSELIASQESERAAGIYSLDTFVGGPTTLGTVFLPRGWLEPIDDDLVAMEVLDESNYVTGNVPWAQGLPWYDDERHVLFSSFFQASQIAINTDLVGEGEITSHMDLLDPKWKGRIVADDPRVTGNGDSVALMLQEEYGDDFLRDLYVGQEVALFSDYRQQQDALNRGQFAVSLAPRHEEVAASMADGLPVDIFIPEDAQGSSGGDTFLAMWANAPHPNAAALFLNWLACPAGNELLNNAQSYQSVRTDVDVDFPEWMAVDPKDENVFHTHDPAVLPRVQEVHELMTTIIGG